KRLISSMILRKNSNNKYYTIPAVNTTIINDDLELFIKHYDETIYKPSKVFYRALIFGSEKIGDYILYEKLKSNYTIYYDAISYVSVSDNIEYAKKIAKLIPADKFNMSMLYG